MIETIAKTIAGIPVLEMVAHDQQADRLPTVIYYHGWLGCKENSLTAGYAFANAGLRVILPDAIYHGQRQDNQPTRAHQADFFKIIMQSIQEYPLLIEDYLKKGLSQANQLAVAGLSMGGITVCGLLAAYPIKQLQAAVCFMGTPYLSAFAKTLADQQASADLPNEPESQIKALEPDDLSMNPQQLDNRRVHFWHGKQDATVPYSPTQSFYQEIKTADFAKQVTFSTDETAGHKVPYPAMVEGAAILSDYFK